MWGVGVVEVRGATAVLALRSGDMDDEITCSADVENGAGKEKRVWPVGRLQGDVHQRGVDEVHLDHACPPGAVSDVDDVPHVEGVRREMLDERLRARGCVSGSGPLHHQEDGVQGHAQRT